MKIRTRRYFSRNEKREIVQKILANEFTVKDAKAKDGTPIWRTSAERWVMMYKLGQLGKIYKNSTDMIQDVFSPKVEVKPKEAIKEVSLPVFTRRHDDVKPTQNPWEPKTTTVNNLRNKLAEAITRSVTLEIENFELKQEVSHYREKRKTKSSDESIAVKQLH